MSTIKNKNNKKINFCVYFLNLVQNRIKKCIFRDQGLVYIKKMLYLCSRKSLEKGAYLQKSRTKKVLE